MGRKSSIEWTSSFVVLVAVALLATSCGGSKKRIVVGSKDGMEQMVLGELVAQHLEHRLERKVERNLGLGNTQIVYQSLINGEIGLYPDDTGTIQARVLKESPSLDAGTTFERVRNELRRIAQTETMEPLGIDNSWAVVVKKDNSIETLSDAERAKSGWKIGVTRDFNERSDGLAALNQYRLPMSAMMRVSDAPSLYAALSTGELTMVVGNRTDGTLTRHDAWKVLGDDRKVFGFYQTCVLARMDLLASDPKIQPALAELSGKITTAAIAKLGAEVSIDHKKPADVVAKFLAQAGLK
jgi:glycine betaine/choline ABC-type transport system substrate-binding protein